MFDWIPWVVMFVTDTTAQTVGIVVVSMTAAVLCPCTAVVLWP